MRAIDYDHLAGIADDGAGAAHVEGDGFAEGEAAGGSAVVEFADGGFAGMAQENAAPHFEGEIVHVAAPAVGEIVAQRAGAAAGEINRGSDTGGGLSVARELQLGGFVALLRLAGAESLRDEGAGTAASAGKTFRDQLIVGEKDYGAGNAELRGEIARGGQAFAGAESAGKDGLAQALVHLAEERFAAPRKWYHELHAKWLYENTTGRLILACAGTSGGRIRNRRNE